MSSLAGPFLDLHVPGTPLLMPNPWDAGSARVLESLGFRALATTSSGFAMSLGRADGQVTRNEAIDHARAVSVAVDVPVSADLEHGFADDPDGVAATVRLALGAGLAGCSIEDSTGRRDEPVYDLGLARDRIAAAAEVAHGGEERLVLTARAENHIRGRDDLADTIHRLQAYQEAGADVLFAPGVVQADAVRSLVSSVDRPVSVLALPGVGSVAELAELGVARISVGGAFAYVAMGAMAAAGRALLESGTFGYFEAMTAGVQAFAGARSRKA